MPPFAGISALNRPRAGGTPHLLPSVLTLRLGSCNGDPVRRVQPSCGDRPGEFTGAKYANNRHSDEELRVLEELKVLIEESPSKKELPPKGPPVGIAVARSPYRTLVPKEVDGIDRFSNRREKFTAIGHV